MLSRSSLLLPILLLGTLASCNRGPKPLSPAAERGRVVFLETSTPKCGTCHRLNEAGTIGVLGPDLDMLRPTKDRVLRSVMQGVGVMPTQKDILTQGQMADVAAYVAEVAGRRPK